MNGNGILLRDAGKLPPSARKQLEKVGNEKITKIVAVRTPLSSTTKTFLNIISLGQFEKISKQYFDDLFHLAFWVNDKYNIEKNEVISFGTKNPIKSNSETINIPVNKNITFNELFENTRKYMGDSNFTSYDAEKNNCQVFLNAILTANGLGSDEDKKWIKQDTDKVFKEIPTFAKVLGNLSTTAGAVVNRLIEGEGRPRRLYITDDGRYYYMSKGKKRFIKAPTGMSQKQIVKINLGNLVKPKKKRKKRGKKKTIRVIGPDGKPVIATISGKPSASGTFGPPPPVAPPKKDDTAIIKAITDIIKYVPREGTKIEEPKVEKEKIKISDVMDDIEEYLENPFLDFEGLDEIDSFRTFLRDFIIKDLPESERLSEFRRLSNNERLQKFYVDTFLKKVKEAEDEVRTTTDETGSTITPIRPSRMMSPAEGFVPPMRPRIPPVRVDTSGLMDDFSMTGKTPRSDVSLASDTSSIYDDYYPNIKNQVFDYLYDRYTAEDIEFTRLPKDDIEDIIRNGIPTDRMDLIDRYYNQLKVDIFDKGEYRRYLGRGKMSGKGEDSNVLVSSCYNPLSIMYAGMPIGIGTNNPTIKTDGIVSTSTPSVPTSETKKEEKKDEPQKPDVAQKGQGLFGDAVNLLYPSTGMTTRILGLGFGMGGGCMCGNGTSFDDFMKNRKPLTKEEMEKNVKQFDSISKGLQDASQKLTGKSIGQNIGESIVKGIVRLAKGNGDEDIPEGFHRMPDGSIMANSEHEGGGEVDGLYNDEIEKITDTLGIEVPVIASDEIYKIVDMINPDTKEFGFIINTDDSKGSGKHWRAIFIDNDEDRPSIEYFDPLGDAPEPKLIEDIKDIVDKLDNDKYFLFKENMIKLQSDDTNTCGHFSIKFLEDRFSGVPWSEATGFKKCMNQEGEGEKEIIKSVKKYENYL